MATRGNAGIGGELRAGDAQQQGRREAKKTTGKTRRKLGRRASCGEKGNFNAPGNLKSEIMGDSPPLVWSASRAALPLLLAALQK